MNTFVQIGIACGLGAASTLALTPVARDLARRVGAVDRGDGKRKLHERPVPLLGGVALLAALWIGLAACGILNVLHEPAAGWGSWPLAAAATLICLVGCCDDLWGLRVRWKLLGQVAATLPIILASPGMDRIALGGITMDTGWLAAPMMLLWLVAGTNALNFVDGVDGLASTVGLTIAGATAWLAWQNGQSDTLLMAAVLGGALVGFLLYNRPPAGVYLGDAGSMLIGLIVSNLAITASRRPSGEVSLVVPVVLLSVPLFDTALAVTRRLLNGQPIWVADRAHVHHQLLDRGLSPGKTVALLSGLSLATGLAACLGVAHHCETLACAFSAMLILGLVHGRFFGHLEWALFRAWLIRSGLDLLVRLWAAHNSAELPSRSELAGLPFGKAWDLFVGVIQRRSVLRLELSVGDTASFGWRQDWGPRVERLKDRNLWTLEVYFDSPGGGWCKLRAVVHEGPATSPRIWLSLLDVLRLFGQHWAAHPGQMPGRHLRLTTQPDRIYRPDRDWQLPSRHEAA